MTGYSATQIWIVIAALGAGSYLIRFSFFGLLGPNALPPWVMAHLRYSAVAIIPGLVAPLVMTGGTTGENLLRLAAAAVALATGWWRKSTLVGILSGAAVMAVGGLI